MEFIYVFTKENKDKLLNMKYVLIKGDDVGSVYIFANPAERHFDLQGDIEYILSNTLTF